MIYHKQSNGVAVFQQVERYETRSTTTRGMAYKLSTIFLVAAEASKPSEHSPRGLASLQWTTIEQHTSCCVLIEK